MGKSKEKQASRKSSSSSATSSSSSASAAAEKSASASGGAEAMEVVDRPEAKSAKSSPEITAALPFFWDLASLDPDVRIAAAIKLVELLVHSPSAALVEYAHDRLLRGLASPREAARQGFATVLCEVLRSAPSDVVASLVVLRDKHLTLEGVQRAAERDACLGRLFFTLCLQNSGALARDSALLLASIADTLAVAARRSSLEDVAVSVMAVLLPGVGRKLMPELVALPAVHAALFDSGVSISPHLLHTLLVLQAQAPELDWPSLTPAWGPSGRVLEAANFVALARILYNPSALAPRLLPAWHAIFSGLAHGATVGGADGLALTTARARALATSALDDMYGSSSERKALGLAICSGAAAALPPSCLSALITAPLISLLSAAAARSHGAHDAADSLVSLLLNRSSSELDARVTVITLLAPLGKFLGRSLGTNASGAIGVAAASAKGAASMDVDDAPAGGRVPTAAERLFAGLDAAAVDSSIAKFEAQLYDALPPAEAEGADAAAAQAKALLAVVDRLHGVVRSSVRVVPDASLERIFVRLLCLAYYTPDAAASAAAPSSASKKAAKATAKSAAAGSDSVIASALAGTKRLAPLAEKTRATITARTNSVIRELTSFKRAAEPGAHARRIGGVRADGRHWVLTLFDTAVAIESAAAGCGMTRAAPATEYGAVLAQSAAAVADLRVQVEGGDERSLAMLHLIVHLHLSMLERPEERAVYLAQALGAYQTVLAAAAAAKQGKRPVKVTPSKLGKSKGKGKAAAPAAAAAAAAAAADGEAEDDAAVPLIDVLLSLLAVPEGAMRELVRQVFGAIVQTVNRAGLGRILDALESRPAEGAEGEADWEDAEAMAVDDEEGSDANSSSGSSAKGKGKGKAQKAAAKEAKSKGKGKLGGKAMGSVSFGSADSSASASGSASSSSSSASNVEGTGSRGKQTRHDTDAAALRARIEASVQTKELAGLLYLKPRAGGKDAGAAKMSGSGSGSSSASSSSSSSASAKSASSLPPATDEEMFKIDLVLADAFVAMSGTARAKASKRDAKQRVVFVQRVVDLLEVFVTSVSDSPLIIELVGPLVDAVKAENNALVKRRLEVLLGTTLARSRETPPVIDLDDEDIAALLSETLDMASRPKRGVTERKVGEAVFLYLLRALHTAGRLPTEHVVTVVSQLFQLYMQHKRRHMKRELFSQVLTRNVHLVSALLPALLPSLHLASSDLLLREGFCVIAKAVTHTARRDAHSAADIGLALTTLTELLTTKVTAMVPVSIRPAQLKQLLDLYLDVARRHQKLELNTVEVVTTAAITPLMTKALKAFGLTPALRACMLGLLKASGVEALKGIEILDAIVGPGKAGDALKAARAQDKKAAKKAARGARQEQKSARKEAIKASASAKGLATPAGRASSSKESMASNLAAASADRTAPRPGGKSASATGKGAPSARPAMVFAAPKRGRETDDDGAGEQRSKRQKGLDA